MINLRKPLAGICSFSLCWATAAWSTEPADSQKQTSAPVPARLSAESEVPALGIRPVEPADYWQRLERAEAQIAELQSQNQSLRESPAPVQQVGFSPLQMAPLFFAHDPEIGIIREQTYTPSMPEAPKDPTKPEAPKPKKWYDKLSIKGYAQFRLNEETHQEEGSFPVHHVGDGSLRDNQNFLIRRARVIISGDVHENVYVYLQTDFASTPSGSPDSNQFAQIRDWYADLYLDELKEFRFRVGQSKIPYGWENLQSSSNRLSLDRNDAFNSAVRNERDLGVFFYYTPTWAQDFFKDVLEKGLKGSGNYGLFGVGAYNGQGGSFLETNDDVHFVARLTIPLVAENGQHMEFGVQGYTGEYTVLGSDLLTTPGTAIPLGTGTATLRNRDGWQDERLGASLIWYPQPLGFQAEWTVGRGPALNAAQTGLQERSLHGGYVLVNYKLDDCYGTWFPFVKYSTFRGGYKSERNAPYASIDEWEFGAEWQINSAAELTASYLITDRTNTIANATTPSYGQFDGQAVRLQLQVNY
ncbi:MAG: porin [Planctomycetaceae bacterium]